MIFETHAHYDDEAFDIDRDKLLAEMYQSGISHIVNVAASLTGIENAVAYAAKYPFVYGTVGVHPNDAAELTEDKLTWMKEICSNPKIVAVGEIGLDYYYDEPDREIQKYWFAKQLGLAKETDMPVIIHSRDAAHDTLAMMKEHAWDGMTGVVHCFSYSREMAEEFCKLNLYIGIGGVVTFANAKKVKETVAHTPIERIVLETDSPYLAPVPYRGKRNSSLYLPLIAKEIASIKGLSYEEVVETTAQNAKKLYRLS